MDSLTSVREILGLAHALRAGATLVGINNRSLHTFEVDLGTSVKLLPHLPP